MSPLDNANADRVTAAVDKLTDAVESFERTLQGSSKEGNPGLLVRVARLEKRQWMFFIALFAGSGLGTYLPKTF